MRHTFLRRAVRILSPLRPAAALVVVTALALSAAPAAANSKYAAIVIDANTGKTLHASSADAPRYPASLTKMMTLYLTFEALKAGKISKNTRVTFSANAAKEPPTKLGVRTGGSITVETAILALVTKSANDASTALGEMLAGSEQNFARMMTAKARKLGMNNTTFRNANGLPNPEQKTTARDMAILGIALREHFPQYYDYFSTRSFTFGKQRLGNHNKLLGRVKGVDGIKTGFTRASGFNLVSSVSDGNRRIVAVVMGGKTGRSRDDQMVKLIKEYLPKASVRKGGPLVASASVSPLETLANAILPKRDAPLPEMRPEDAQVAQLGESQREEKSVEETIGEGSTETDAPVVQAYAEPAPARVDRASTASVVPSGWAVQVASSPSEREAKALLASVGDKAGRLLADASPYTVPFEKGGTLYFRARFGGFDSKTAAWNTCGALKKKKIACYAVQQ